MNLLPTNLDGLLVWAQRHRLEDVVDNLGTGFREARDPWSTQNYVTLGAVVLVGSVAAYVIVRLGGLAARRIRNSPAWLFLCLCRAHRLKWRDRWLLWQLSGQSRLLEPGLLFVRAELFAGDRLPAALTPAAARLAELQAQLFADPDAAKEKERVRVFPAAAEPAPQLATASEPLIPSQEPPAEPSGRSPLLPLIVAPQLSDLAAGVMSND